MNDWFEAEQRIERAQQLSESQHWEEALAEIDAALSINPNHAAWHAHRGFLLEELDQWDEAAAAYETALKLDSGDADIAVSLGVVLSQLGRFGQALAVFEDLTRLHPDFEPAYCHRIGIYSELGRHAQAEEMFYLAQELNDACPHCFFSIGVSLAARGQTDRAIFCWQRVLELDATYVGVNRRIAQALRTKGKRDQAREYYLREVRDDPGNTDLLHELADLALESGDHAAAVAKFAQILELDPSHLESHIGLGAIWLRRGQPGPALSCFERVLTLTAGDPDLAGLDRLMGEALLNLGRFAEARERLAQAADQDAGDVNVLVMLGRCLLSMGKLEEAADTFRRVLAPDADNAVAHGLLGVCLLQLGRHTAALDHCLSAIRAKPDYGAAMCTAIRAHLQLAQWREARSMLRRALLINSGSAELRRLAKGLWRYRVQHYLRKVIVPFQRAFLHSRS